MKNGITVAGNILADVVKTVEAYPDKGMLSTITSITQAVGGSVSNTGIALKKIDGNLRVNAVGRIGDDDSGRYVLSVLKRNGLNVDGVKISKNSNTSFSDVITVSGTGERTFFHYRGANAEFCPEDVDVNGLDCEIFHIGYIMLLDVMDAFEGDITKMAKLLDNVRKRGVKTSIDVVSESSGDFNRTVTAALPFADYVIINEIEAGNVTGIRPRDDNGKLINESIKAMMSDILSRGVHEKVVVHCPEYGFCLDKSGRFTSVPSINLPKGFIKGSVGAGDAFCAGCLYGIYSGWNDENILTFANLVAVSCLSEKDSISGIRSAKELLNGSFLHEKGVI